MQEKRQKATNHNLIFLKKNNKKHRFKMVLNGDKTLCSNVGLLKQ